eukprot:TRINITY_DN27267_c0_g1_i1.p2 TRINITY_DN27267_c0_g1~~TRINITY_DN27267_c0_g1_i1.p2  ORF type:complete len:135 (-),score=7.33 TRINITY_DN27267_c0_g1_i1:70-474(-)
MQFSSSLLCQCVFQSSSNASVGFLAVGSMTVSLHDLYRQGGSWPGFLFSLLHDTAYARTHVLGSFMPRHEFDLPFEARAADARTSGPDCTRYSKSIVWETDGLVEFSLMRNHASFICQFHELSNRARNHYAFSS